MNVVLFHLYIQNVQRQPFSSLSACHPFHFFYLSTSLKSHTFNFFFFTALTIKQVFSNLLGMVEQGYNFLLLPFHLICILYLTCLERKGLLQNKKRPFTYTVLRPTWFSWRYFLIAVKWHFWQRERKWQRLNHCLSLTKLRIFHSNTIASLCKTFLKH